MNMKKEKYLEYKKLKLILMYNNKINRLYILSQIFSGKKFLQNFFYFKSISF